MPKIMVSLAQRFQPVSFQAGGAGACAAWRSNFYYKYDRIPQL